MNHHDHAAEAAVLGAVMLHPASFDRVLDVGLTVAAFHLGLLIVPIRRGCGP